MKRSTLTLAGCGSSAAGSWSRPTVATSWIGSAASAPITVPKRSRFELKRVPNVTYTTGGSARCRGIVGRGAGRRNRDSPTGTSASSQDGGQTWIVRSRYMPAQPGTSSPCSRQIGDTASFASMTASIGGSGPNRLRPQPCPLQRRQGGEPGPHGRYPEDFRGQWPGERERFEHDHIGI